MPRFDESSPFLRLRTQLFGAINLGPQSDARPSDDTAALWDYLTARHEANDTYVTGDVSRDLALLKSIHTDADVTLSATELLPLTRLIASVESGGRR